MTAFATAPARACDHTTGCITCGDEAVAMRVVSVDDGRGLALCEDGDGRRETVEIALVAPVAGGDALLVHAATAIGRSGEARRSTEAGGRGADSDRESGGLAEVTP
jgi:hydrogenase maturation factor